MSDLKTYLASKYMSGPKADAILSRSTDPTVKKRKKKPKNEDYIGGSSSKGESSGLVFRDEEDEWERRRREELDTEGDDAPVVGKELATFKKSSTQWNTVSSSTSLPLPGAPVNVKEEPTDDDVGASAAVIPPKQMTKRRGGLRTAAELQAEVERAAAERSPSPEPDADRPDPTVTVHRDASGRVLDVAKLKEEERLRELEEKRKEKEKEEWSKGLVQRQQREERAREEREMAKRDVARYADDSAMNREMQEVERWNDPAAEFLTKKKKKGPRRPRYEKAFPPNRFAIPPGFRWDGVDRSNGFENKFFQYQNKAAREVYEHNKWSAEDM